MNSSTFILVFLSCVYRVSTYCWFKVTHSRSRKRRKCMEHDIHEKEKKEEEDEADCGICLESIEPPQSKCQLRNCGHIFHTRCILKWFVQKKSCPVCRSDNIRCNHGCVDNHNTSMLRYMIRCQEKEIMALRSKNQEMQNELEAHEHAQRDQDYMFLRFLLENNNSTLSLYRLFAREEQQ